MALFGKAPETKPADSTGAAPKPATPPPAAPAPASAPGRAPGPAPASSVCVIGAKTIIKGEITGDEDVLIEGRVEGQIRISRDVRVGASGVVKSAIDASSVVVSGEVIGDCTATNRVEIQASGKLTGNIRAPKIVISEGAMFKGNSDMSSGKS
jgi:cytoskeletal protein CcmA (bactofilin family)